MTIEITRMRENAIDRAKSMTSALAVKASMEKFRGMTKAEKCWHLSADSTDEERELKFRHRDNLIWAPGNDRRPAAWGEVRASSVNVLEGIA